MFSDQVQAMVYMHNGASNSIEQRKENWFAKGCWDTVCQVVLLNALAVATKSGTEGYNS